jgi:antitoxin CptB
MVGDKRIRWRCRRGIRELDLLLTRFVDEQLTTLTSSERAVFERLLNENDFDLLLWLTGKQLPEDVHLRGLIGRMCGDMVRSPERSS